MLHCKLENALLERSHFDALECSGNPNARENFPPAMLQCCGYCHWRSIRQMLLRWLLSCSHKVLSDILAPLRHLSECFWNSGNKFPNYARELKIKKQNYYLGRLDCNLVFTHEEKNGVLCVAERGKC